MRCHNVNSVNKCHVMISIDRYPAPEIFPNGKRSRDSSAVCRLCSYLWLFSLLLCPLIVLHTNYGSVVIFAIWARLAIYTSREWCHFHFCSSGVPIFSPLQVIATLPLLSTVRIFSNKGFIGVWDIWLYTPSSV